ncbi:MAG: hypothetical protein HPY66_2655 [Firmicutes bacterium]|nr:hypothetical protein [Bacillota bacterium]
MLVVCKDNIMVTRIKSRIIVNNKYLYTNISTICE